MGVSELIGPPEQAAKTGDWCSSTAAMTSRRRAAKTDSGYAHSSATPPGTRCNYGQTVMRAQKQLPNLSEAS
jgi:hypothetical protein